MYRIIFLSLIIIAIASLSSCLRLDRHGSKNSPPAHAPAVGRRAQDAVFHNYLFYPSLSIYYNPLDRVYFYLSNNVWVSAPVLPGHFSRDLGASVKIKVDGKKPYLKFKEHKKKYPPGLKKKKNKSNGSQGYGMGRGMGNGR